MRNQATARVAGETHGVIDANRIRLIAEEDDFDEAELLQFVNIGKLRFKEIDTDHARDYLKWISFYMKQSGFKYRLTLNYKQGALTGYELSAEPSFAHSLMVEHKFKAKSASIDPRQVEAEFVKLRSEAAAKASSLLKTPASFQLGRFNMVKFNNNYSPSDWVRVIFVSRENDTEDNALVILTLNLTDRKIHSIELAGNMLDVAEDSAFEVLEEGPAALKRALATEFKTFDELTTLLNTNKDLNSILNKLTPQCGREERVIMLDIQNRTPISESELKHPEELFDSGNSAYVIFKDAATRNTALEALRKVISDNGGKIVYENELKLKDGQ